MNFSPSIFSFFCQFYRDWMIWMEPWRSVGLINSARICGRRFHGEEWHYQRPVWCVGISHRGSVWMPCLLDCSFDCFNYETCFHYCCHHCIIINIINNWPAPPSASRPPLTHYEQRHVWGELSAKIHNFIWDETKENHNDSISFITSERND